MIDSNLTLTDYGITLRRLTHDKIEMVRQWRNDPKIQQYMIFRDYITPEMQEKWFQKVNNDNNLYFIIEYEKLDVGLINVKDIELDEGIGEGGIFIYDDRFLNKDISYRAHILLLDFFFEILGLNGITSEIFLSNERAIRFAQFLGSKFLRYVDSSESIGYFMLSREDYLNNKNREHFKKRWHHQKTKYSNISQI